MADRLVLSGLIASNPLGALGAYGLLRVLDEHGHGARLCFELRDDWIVTLEQSDFASVDELVRWLSDWIATRETPELEWAQDVRVPPEQFREELSRAESRRQVFLAAMAAEGVVDKSKHLIKPSPLYMASGQMSFFGGLRSILADLRKEPVRRFTEALVGPWTYKTELHSLGWDPAGERLYALRARAPTATNPVCVPAAVWLAYESMPIFTVFASRGRVAASGFHRIDGETCLVWPILDRPVGYRELKSLLRSGEYVSRDRRRGIREVFCSVRHEYGQGYAVFRPAEALLKQDDELHGVSAERLDLIVPAEGGSSPPEQLAAVLSALAQSR